MEQVAHARHGRPQRLGIAQVAVGELDVDAVEVAARAGGAHQRAHGIAPLAGARPPPTRRSRWLPSPKPVPGCSSRLLPSAKPGRGAFGSWNRPGLQHDAGTVIRQKAGGPTFNEQAGQGGHLVAFIALAIWIYLIAARGDFWIAGERDDRRRRPRRKTWPRVIAVIPARDEADGVGDDRRLAAAAGLSRRFLRHAGGRPEHRRHRRGGAPRRRGRQAADRLTVIPGAAAGRLDRQALGDAAGRRRRRRRGRRPNICCSPTPTSSMRPTRCRGSSRRRRRSNSC